MGARSCAVARVVLLGPAASLSLSEGGVPGTGSAEASAAVSVAAAFKFSSSAVWVPPVPPPRKLLWPGREQRRAA